MSETNQLASNEVITLSIFSGDNNVKLASKLSGKTIQYKTKKPSTVTGGYRRNFKIMEVDDVFESQSTSEQCVCVYVADLDVEGAPLKYRTLHVNRIKTLT